MNSIEITFTNEQFQTAWKDDSFRELVADKLVEKVPEKTMAKILDDITRIASSLFLVPVSFAARLTGFGVNKIKRNLPIVKEEGQQDSICLGDVFAAIENRKDK